jgi:hypothetical protein
MRVLLKPSREGDVCLCLYLYYKTKKSTVRGIETITE